jgi:hypothetical protein
MVAARMVRALALVGGLAVLGTAGCGGAKQAAETATTVAPTTTAEPPTTTTATTEPPTTVRMVATTTTARPATTAPPTTAAAKSNCHPSYEGTCIPPDVSDADCAGGSGNGPWYVKEKNIRVVGPDVFDLDRDGNGIGCQT